MSIELTSMAGGGFKVVDLLHVDLFHEYPFLGAGAVGASVILLSMVAYKIVAPKLIAQSDNDKDFIPPSNLGNRNILDMIAGFVQGFSKDNIGKHYVEFLPLLIFIFLWTLVNNLLGLIPGFGSATDDLNTTLAMGAVTFVYYNVMGFKHLGFKYLEHYMGHLPRSVLWLAPLMIVIEVVSNLARPVSLGIRLRSNIFGDHMVYGIISDLVHSFGTAIGVKLGFVGEVIGWIITALGPVPIVALGIMVCVIQAFVFTLLTTIYVGMATAHHDEGHHH
jgi:F-type H+-transporting ATPase subunit a